MNILEILRDPLWQFIGIIVVIFGIVYPIRQRKRELSYEYSNYSLVSVEEPIENEISVYFKKKLVKNVNLLFVKIINSGKVPLKPQDYERPLRLLFDKEEKILQFAISSELNPKNLRVRAKKEKGAIILEPILLNSGDFFTIQILVDGNGTMPAIDYRIVGVKKIKKFSSEKNESLIILLVGVLLIISNEIFPIIFSTFCGNNYLVCNKYTLFIAMLFFPVGLFLLVFGIFKHPGFQDLISRMAAFITDLDFKIRKK